MILVHVTVLISGHTNQTQKRVHYVLLRYGEEHKFGSLTAFPVGYKDEHEFLK